ncbi:MAG TPA: thioredoxin family protein [Bacteroidota bacterium]
MKRLILCVSFFVVIACAFAHEGGGGDATYVPVTRFDPARDAANDIRLAVTEARTSGRRVLLDVGGDWCIWCRRLDTLFTAHRELVEYRDAHYVVVKVNWSKENKNEGVLSRYPAVSGYPHLFVLGSDGSLVHSQDTGALEKGRGHDPEKVMAFLKKWAP